MSLVKLLYALITKINPGIFLILVFLFPFQIIHTQSIDIKIKGYDGKIYLSRVTGEKTLHVDSAALSKSGVYKFLLSNNKSQPGVYRILFDNNKWIDFINDDENVSIETNANNVLDSLKVTKSASNELFYSFLKLNKAYKTKTELLQMMLARYPKDDDYYKTTQNKLTQIQNGYIEFVNITAQGKPASFIARYIKSAQLPVLDADIQPQQQLAYLKVHALDNIDFNSSTLIYSDVFTNKTIEYLTYFRNPQLPKELLEKEFMKAVDTLLNKAKVNQLVYQHITEYLIDGFKKFGFDKIIDYIVENYVIKDDLCLDVKTEGLIKRRIEQAKYFKTGSIVPNIIIADTAGKEINLHNIKAGKKLIVFYASWCPHCKELLPKLNDLRKRLSAKNFEIFAVSLDTKREDWTSFVRVNHLELINISDMKGWDGIAASNYFIYATPTMFLVDKDDKIIGKPTTYEELTALIQ